MAFGHPGEACLAPAKMASARIDMGRCAPMSYLYPASRTTTARHEHRRSRQASTLRVDFISHQDRGSRWEDVFSPLAHQMPATWYKAAHPVLRGGGGGATFPRLRQSSSERYS